jgi:dynein intermediate chain
LAVVGTQNAHNIVSLSNDGILCSWSFSISNEPQKNIDLKVGDNRFDLAAHCIAFPEDSKNQFYIGAEDSNIYMA